MTRKLKNVAHSVQQRLKNLARQTGQDFNRLLVRYVLERFLYRLGLSRYADKFILKGAMLLAAWTDQPYRATQDIDLLGIGSNEAEDIAAAFREIFAVEIPAEDGVRFDPGTIETGTIRNDTRYVGIRFRTLAYVGNARVLVSVDVGFGDAITPRPETIEFPALLDFPKPCLQVYPKETSVAEKFQAMVERGELNSRMKDFADIWFLSHHFNFDGAALANAITETFRRRDMTMPANPVPLSQEFGENPMKQTQWAAFLRKGKLTDPPANFAEVIDVLRHFLLPIAQTIAAGGKFAQTWVANEQWKG